jgi:hypothetical protein
MIAKIKELKLINLNPSSLLKSQSSKSISRKKKLLKIRLQYSRTKEKSYYREEILSKKTLISRLLRW